MVNDRRAPQTDKQDHFMAMQKRRQMEKKALRNDPSMPDPMELELLSQANVIMRLNKMKNVLKSGKVISQNRIEERMGDSLTS